MRSSTARRSGDFWASGVHRSETTAGRSLCNWRSNAHQIKFGICVSFASSSCRASRNRIASRFACSKALARRRELASHLWIRLFLGQTDEPGEDGRIRAMVVSEQTDRPASDCGNGVVEQFERDSVVESAAGMKRPEVARGDRLVSILPQEVLELRHDRSIAALRKQPPCLLGKPVVRAISEGNQLGARSTGEIKRRNPASLAIDDAVDPPVSAIPGVARIEMGGALVVPVDDVNRRVRSDQEVDWPEPSVTCVDQGAAVASPER